MKTVQGNLIEAWLNNEVDVILHCANCFNTMGSGFAKELRERIPEAYEADCKTIKGHPDKLGSYSKVCIDDKFIYNVYGQYRYGLEQRHVNYAALGGALFDIAHYLGRHLQGDGPRKLRIGFPLMGCDRAGGDWKIVEALIQDAFHCTEMFELFLYKLD